ACRAESPTSPRTGPTLTLGRSELQISNRGPEASPGGDRVSAAECRDVELIGAPGRRARRPALPRTQADRKRLDAYLTPPNLPPTVAQTVAHVRTNYENPVNTGS